MFPTDSFTLKGALENWRLSWFNHPIPRFQEQVRPTAGAHLIVSNHDVYEWLHSPIVFELSNVSWHEVRVRFIHTKRVTDRDDALNHHK